MFRGIGFAIAFATLALLGTSCTGGANSPVNGSNGSIKIDPGQKLTIDLSDVVALNISDYTLSLRTVNDDYSSSTVLYDLTTLLQQAGNATQFSFVIPKVVAEVARPMLVVVDIPSLNTQLIDVIYDGDVTATPGIASTMTYTLLKYYPGKTLHDYQSADFHGIQALIQAREDALIADSDYLNFATTAYAKIIRYFTNGVAFNPTFLSAIRNFGVNYTYSLTTPPGIAAADAPEGSLANYQYATTFLINGAPAQTNPFNQTNNPPQLLPGGSIPSPGTGIFVSEGNSVSMLSQGFDIDGDYIDKNMIVVYTPRVLPTVLNGTPITSAPGFPFVPEPTPEYTTITALSGPTGTDQYTSNVIGYNEALDMSVYQSNTVPPTPLQFDPTLYPNAIQVDTAYRDVYYLISDGMIRIPFHWNFKYADINRQPQIVRDANGKMNDSSLDPLIATGETEEYPGTGWLEHGSHCESDPNVSYQGIDPQTGLPEIEFYEVIKSKLETPWSCAFRVTDIDIDQDPNAAADSFYYSVNMQDNSTVVNFGVSSNSLFPWPSLTRTQAWPVYIGPPYVPSRFAGTTINNCTTPDGITHPRCGQALYQVVIDNSVKAAADARASSVFSYGIVVYDRAVGGFQNSATLNRTIEIPSNPARLMNVSAVPTPAGDASNSTLTLTNPSDPNSAKIYLRQDIYLSEILNMANPLSAQLSTIGMGNNDLTSSLTGPVRSADFFVGSSQEMSPYIGFPYNVVGGTITKDNTNPALPVVTNASPGTIQMIGLDLTPTSTPTYSFPREYDSTCKLYSNNLGTGWSQTFATATQVSTGNEGWIFEIDAVDPDNIALNVGEVTDPVHLSLTHDVNVTLNALGLQFCAYSTPNSDPFYYQTYASTAVAPAVANQVDPNACTWGSAPPSDMQPIPVYYNQLQSDGTIAVKKWVYHRLRVKWQPKDQGLTNKWDTVNNTCLAGYTWNATLKTCDPQGYLQNLIKSGLRMYGNRYVQLTDVLDQNIVTSPLKFFAQRKDMAPCLSGLSGYKSTAGNFINQLNTSLTAPIKFAVSDENQVLGGAAAYSTMGALMGRSEAELQLMGNRDINNENFLRWVLFTKNCSVQDEGDPTGSPPVVPVIRTLSEPAMWYTQASDTNNTPRIRFQSETDPGTAAPFCVNFSYTPLVNSASVTYNEVILIQNLNTTAPYTISNNVLTNCTALGTTSGPARVITMNPDQKYMAIAATCGASPTPANGYVWQDANSQAVVKYILDPTTVDSGGYPAGTTAAKFNLDMFPSFYGSQAAGGSGSFYSGYPAALNEPNGLFFSATYFDGFRLDPTTLMPTYVGYVKNGSEVWLPNDTTFAPGPAPAAPATPTPYFATNLTVLPTPQGWATAVEEVDWDNQPSNMTIVMATPTPAPTGNTFFRMAPGDATTIQVYIKNQATVSFPIRVSDTLLTAAYDLDAFDILQYSLIPPSATPASTPFFTGTATGVNRGADCKGAPAGYPTSSGYNPVTNAAAFNVSTIANYKSCGFSWTPNASDSGKKFAYTFAVQDNYSTPWAGGAVAGGGVGASHPANALSPIPFDTLTATNGPATTYNISMEALETNTPPFFTNSSGTAAPAAYLAAGGGSGWTNVFSSTNGIQPSGCTAQTGFSCNLLSISPGATPSGANPSPSPADTLANSTVIPMTEGSQQSFTVYAKDSNVTANLKTLTATKPTSVLIVDGVHAGRSYTVPSFAAMTMSTTQNVASGTATFTFSWTPTDAEANYLSNPGGFLIPVKVSDQTYYPATDAGFPPGFDVQAIPSTTWIWANVSVKNSQPSLTYILAGSTAENAFSGAPITLQTNATTSFTIRVRDTDVARWTQSGETAAAEGLAAGFTPTFSGPGFSAPAPVGTPYYIAPNIIQDFVVTASPAPSDIGIYNATVTVTDPGDPSLGLAVNPNPTPPPTGTPSPTTRAQVFNNGNTFTTPFTIQVIGKPIFQAPTTTNYQANVYATKSFYYPLSMFISRPSEKLQNFFIGIDSSTPTTPVKLATTGANSTGIYVNEKYVLRWPDASALNINGNTRVLPIYGVLQSWCNVAGTTALTLTRFNESTGLIETCKLTAANVTANAVSGSATLNLLDASLLHATGPTLTQTEVDRTYSPAPTPANLALAMDQQFSDFYGRCNYCTASPTLINVNSVTQNANTTAFQLNPVAWGMTGSAEYDTSSYKAKFAFDNTNNGFVLTKSYVDTAPTTARSLNVSARKGETLAFKATPGGTTSTPYFQYRWYVNGCLAQSGFVTGSVIEYDLTISSLMSGTNNDCTGEYGFTSETGATALGKLVVRLDIASGNEVLSGTSEGATTYYLWNVNVINTNPIITTTSTFTPLGTPYPANPVVFDSTFMTGNSNVQFAMPVTYSSKNYFAFTDLSSASGMSVRLREVNAGGNLPSTGSILQLTCDTSFNVEPQWLGIQPETDGSLYVSTSNVYSNPYPSGASAGLSYGLKSSTCFTKSLTTTAPTQSFVAYSSSTVPAGYLAFSKYAMGSNATASYSTTAALYKDGTNDSNFFLLDGQNSTNQFWAYPLATLYSASPTPFNGAFPNDVVRKNVVSGNVNFQLIGATSASASGTRGFILINDLAQKSSPNVQLSGTTVGQIMFSDGTGAAPTPTANDCNFNGTPLDGVYVAETDTFYALAFASDVTGMGHLVGIKSPTTNATCSRLDLANPTLLNPSLVNNNHNPNISKMAYDSANGLIYGVINQGTGLSSQFYVYDIFAQTLITSTISPSISSYELVFVPGVNGVYLFDNRKTLTGGSTCSSWLLCPTLYKVW